MPLRALALVTILVAAAGTADSTQAPTAPPVKLSSFDTDANALVATMTLDEKVGQMTQPDQSS